jgi:hypothetical protein
VTFVSLLGAVGARSLAQDQDAQLAREYNITPVPFNSVRLQDKFWTPRLETNRKVTLPYCFQKCEETDRISNFEKAAGLKEGRHEGIYFNDSDVYKIMEGAAYSLQVHPETMMRLYLDKLITVMAGAQWEDGYLYTFYSIPERRPDLRWTDIQSKHEQYCVGHMYEAAVAHYQVTGDTSFLDVATRNADLICHTFAPGKRTDPPGHQEIEIGLCKLYRATGNEKYLNQAKFFLDQRGRGGNRGPDGKKGLYGEYSQDHKPVTEQTTALGHSVRAAYLYTGMADVAALTGSMEYVEAIARIWEDVVGTKLYVTGGIGASGGNEGFSEPYELPNVTAYCETCASIANILWNHRMFLMHGHGKYLDVLERTLYNAALSGISMRGDRFFYPNPVESFGQHGRSPWFGCACCPSNVARFVPSVPGLAYACKGRDVYVSLFASGYTTIDTDDNKVRLIQETDYPWSGKVKITVEPEKDSAFAVRVRIPGWARNEPVPSGLYRFAEDVAQSPSLVVNGQRQEMTVEEGFAVVNRTWKAGDTIELDLPMPVRRVLAHRKVKADWGKVALQRGPIVFCLEGPDNRQGVLHLIIPDDAELFSTFRPDLLGGVRVVTGQARVAKRTLDGRVITTPETAHFTAIPYYAWSHRGPAQMTVWPARIPEAAKPEPADTLTYLSETTASFVHVSLDAIKDQILPENSADTSNRHLDFWDHRGTTEWVRFEWDREHEIFSVRVYWFDDTGRGACHVPESWRVLYRNDEGRFVPVKNKTAYTTKKDTFNRVHFERVQTDAILIEIELQRQWSAGIQEVVID